MREYLKIRSNACRVRGMDSERIKRIADFLEKLSIFQGGNDIREYLVDFIA